MSKNSNNFLNHGEKSFSKSQDFVTKFKDCKTQSEDSFTRSEDFIKRYKKNLSLEGIHQAILCFIPSLSQSFEKNYSTKKIKNLGAQFLICKEKSLVMVNGFGFGAPASIIQLEYLKAFGIKNIFSLGLAGTLNKELKIGDKVFIKNAFSDEGVSKHYQDKKNFKHNQCEANSKERKIEYKDTIDDISNDDISNDDISKKIYSLLENLKIPSCTSWTTDAPYRETPSQIKKYQEQGASLVEMEASALLNVSKFYSLSCFCFAIISDEVYGKKWNFDFKNPLIKKEGDFFLKSLMDSI